METVQNMAALVDLKGGYP